MDNAPGSDVPAYWLLSDDRLDLSTSASQAGLFKAHFKHSVLFNSQLVIPDSYAVNNYNFRTLLRGDAQIRQLVADQVLRIACRADEEGRPRSLLEIRDSMLPDKRPKEFTDEEYRSDEELRYLMEVAPLDTYTLDAVAERYATKALEVFRSGRAAQKLGDGKIASAVARLIEEAAAAGGASAERAPGTPPRFGRAYFYYELEKQFPAATGAPWEAFKGPVLALANAPYLTALPSVLSLEPVYAPQHREAFEIVRGARGEPEPIAEFSFATKLGIHSFVKGIEMLSIDDLHWLPSTDEARSLQRLLESDRAPADVRELAAAVQAYQQRIEDRIIMRFRGLTAESSDGSAKRLSAAVDSVAGVTGDALAFLSLGFSSIGMNVLGVVLTTPVRAVLKRATGLEKRRESEEAERRRLLAEMRDAKDRLVHSLLEEGDADRIDAQGYWGIEGLETLYQAVR